ncbi:MAG: putative Stringent starvation protein [Pseudomonadota bacterium]|jgi:stringent starvation protein B
MIDSSSSTSTRPYLIRALYEWCTDNGYTPYVAVRVDGTVRVPPEFVKDGEIVLNISFDATSSLKLGNEFIEFKARFAGTPREILVPIQNVMAIYARENGQGMAFPAIQPVMNDGSASIEAEKGLDVSSSAHHGDSKLKPVAAVPNHENGGSMPSDGQKSPTRPSLTRVK